MTEHHSGSLDLFGTGNPDAPQDEAERFRTEPEPDLGRHAYEAYCAATGWKSLASGGDLPSWEDQGPEYRAAWQIAATAVANLVLS